MTKSAPAVARTALAVGILTFGILTFGILASALPANAQSPSGIWLTKDQDARVRISDCDGAICGTIVWLKEPIDKQTGVPAVDQHNPDAAKRSRPLLGIQVMYGMRPSGAGRWTGHLYNADDGKTYEGNLVVVGPDSVKVEGCLIGICMGETWQRVQSAARPPHRTTKAQHRS
jgi:uncharacterized protein (DUF2147 family)